MSKRIDSGKNVNAESSKDDQRPKGQPETRQVLFSFPPFCDSSRSGRGLIKVINGFVDYYWGKQLADTVGCSLDENFNQFICRYDTTPAAARKLSASTDSGFHSVCLTGCQTLL